MTIVSSVKEWAEKHNLPYGIVEEANNKVQQKQYDFSVKQVDEIRKSNPHTIIKDSDLSEFICPGTVIHISEIALENELAELGYIDTGMSGPSFCFQISLHLSTLELLGGSINKRKIEKAVLAYTENNPDVDKDKYIVDQSPLRKTCRVTLNKTVWDEIEKLNNGRRLKTAIIEIAIVKMYGGFGK